MSNDSNCEFCKPKKEIVERISFQSGLSNRGIYEDDYCFAVLAPEQYSIGHTLLILEKHKSDITDNISEEELSAFIKAIHKISTHLKEKAKNEFEQSPERIYVCILCDGVEHLHAHLIPRYPFTGIDGNVYEQIFLERDGRKQINKNIQEDKLGGFWYIAERERNHKKSIFGQMPNKERAEFLERLAKQLRIN